MNGDTRDTIACCIAIAIVCMVCVFSVSAYFIPIWSQARSLESIATELRSIGQAIRIQAERREGEHD